VISEAALRAKGRAVVRHAGAQVLLIASERGLFACANRCPHEGYPLSEGVLTEGCILTCNWHNWKFDLVGGRTLVGGDVLRRYPVKAEDGQVLVDFSPEDPEARRARALAGMLRAMAEEDQARIVREAARQMRLGADLALPLTAAIGWAAERLEFGTGHAIAGGVEWLGLAERRSVGADRQLAALGEILGHLADEARGGARLYPFPEGQRAWNAGQFLAAVEAEDEPGAIALIRGALAEGLTPGALMPVLARAALGHYADFGHSLIYAVKTCALAERLGPEAAGPLLLMLTRSLIYATREDLLPEFRTYAQRLGEWGKARRAAPPLAPEAVTGRSAREAMAIVAAWSEREPPTAILATLIEGGAWMLLHADERVFTSAEGKLRDNVNWLDFTHTLTFAAAGGEAARRDADLMPAVLLQLACFIGRNAGFIDRALETEAFAIADAGAFAAAARERIFDHGLERFIVSVHLLKTLNAGLQLARVYPAAAPTILAAVNRFLHAPFKRRHVLRTARQMRAFVAME
jgi:nitrite reductase/ring-hydroxylating ferredoxin subunit